MISSSRNPRIRTIRALADARTRRQRGRTIVEGLRLVDAALTHGEVTFVLFEAGAGDAIGRLASSARQREIEVAACTRAVLAAAAQTETPAGILAEVSIPKPAARSGARLTLVIDGVQDPGNMGALVRTAAAAAATDVCWLAGGADPFGPKAMRAGAGAQFQIPVWAAATAESVRAALEGARIHAAAADGSHDYAEVDWTGPQALIIGSEAHGVSAPLRGLADDSVRIPMSLEVDSLNAAAAAAVILFAAARQRAQASHAESSGVERTH